MGLAIDPNQLHEYVLSTDKDKPEGERPTLLFRFPTYRQFKTVVTLFAESRVSEEDDVAFGKIVEGMRVLLAGWKNIPTPYTPGSIEDVVSVTDLLEVRNTLLESLTVNELDKKKQSSQSQSKPVQSASETATETVQPTTP